MRRMSGETTLNGITSSGREEPSYSFLVSDSVKSPLYWAKVAGLGVGPLPRPPLKAPRVAFMFDAPRVYPPLALLAYFLTA